MVTEGQVRLGCSACGVVDCPMSSVVLLVAETGTQVHFDCPGCAHRRVLDVDDHGVRVLSAYGVETAIGHVVPSSPRTTGS